MTIRAAARAPRPTRGRRVRSAVVLGVFVLLLAAIAAFEQTVSTGSASGWFSRSEQVIWTPPQWFSRTVWAVVFLLLAVVGWRTWRRTAAPRSLARATHVVALVLLTVWPPVYLGGYPVLGTTALWIAFLLALLLVVSLIVLTTVLWDIARLTALLLVPVVVWLLYVASINLGDAVLATLD